MSETKSLRFRSGFTVVELIVSVAIIIGLVFIFVVGCGDDDDESKDKDYFGSVFKAREKARQGVCAANLKGWHMAIAMYHAEHNYLPGSWSRGSSKSVFWSDQARQLQNNPPTAEISFEKMYPYLPGFDLDNNENAKTWKLNGAWVCPSVCKQGAIANPAKVGTSQANMHYAYYARVSEWTGPGNYGPGEPRGTANVSDYVDTTLGGQRLLMSDMILSRRVQGDKSKSWLYNHGKNGPKAVFSDKSQQPDYASTNADITGLNQLYGHGAVEWVPRSKMALDDLKKFRTEEHDHGPVRE